MKRILIIPTIAVASLMFNSCSKDDDSNNTTTPTATYPDKLDGYYEAWGGGDTVVIQFTSDRGNITYLDTDNPMATNSSILKIGDPYFKNIKKLSDNKWQVDIIKPEYDVKGYRDKTLKAITYETTELKYDDKEGKKVSVTDPLDLHWWFDKTDNPQGTKGKSSGGGNGGGGNGGGGGGCIEGTWYNTACGDSKGVVWIFNSNGSGSFSNKDCNNICTPFKLKFTYSITGSSCQVTYLESSLQDDINCTGYAPKKPTIPTKSEPFTFTCDGYNLKVTSGNGTTTFKKNP